MKKMIILAVGILSVFLGAYIAAKCDSPAIIYAIGMVAGSIYGTCTNVFFNGKSI